MGATLADGGVNPLTGERVVDAETCRHTLAVMTTAGLYETSGDWLYDVGLPGKSGIGGGIVTVSPGKGGLGTFAPPLDAAGNSVKGQLVARFLSAAARPRPVRLGGRCDVRRRSRSSLLAALALVLRRSPAPTWPTSRRSPSATRPVVRLVEQQEACGPGEPYEPMDVDALFDEPTVALRGPWSATDLVKIAPARDGPRRPLRVPPRLPGQRARSRLRLRAAGRAASPRASGRRSTRTSRPTGDRPGKLALQYWLFYVFNDWNNLHEGDWEMIQLIFDANDAREALGERPSRSATASTRAPSAPAGTTTSSSSVGGTHPVVYPAAGSHANFYDEALYLGSSAEQGVGCDDTRGPHVDAAPGRDHDPERPGRGARRRSRGSGSRAAGASCSRRSTTARPART